MIDMEGTHENEDEQSDAWQTVGAVTAKLLLHLMEVDFHAVDDVELVDHKPADNDLVERHAGLR